MEREEREAMCIATGRRIREIRTRRGITKERLAEMVGITTQYLGDLERGQKCMNYTILARMSRQLEVSTDYLCFGELRVDPSADEVVRSLMDLSPVEREMTAHMIVQAARIIKGLQARCEEAGPWR